MRDEPVNFLISSAGRRGELVHIFRNVIDAMGGNGKVIATDMSQLTSAGWLADALERVPPVGDPQFIDAVLDICERHAITHLVPTIDTELATYAAARSQFAASGVNVWVSSMETIRIAQDKRLTNSWLRDHGFPAPLQQDLPSADRFDSLSYPKIAKPASGSSSVGLARADGPNDLRSLDRRLDYVVEDIVPGVEHTVDVLVDAQGRCQTAVPRRRLETRAGEVSKGLTVNDTELIDLASTIAETLPQAYGVLNVQIFRDANSDTLNVIEINARFGGGFPLSWAAGARMPLWLALEHADAAPTSNLLAWEDDLLMLRYDAARYVSAHERQIST